MLRGVDQLDNLLFIQLNIFDLRSHLRLVKLNLLERIQVIELKTGTRCLITRINALTISIGNLLRNWRLVIILNVNFFDIVIGPVLITKKHLFS